MQSTNEPKLKHIINQTQVINNFNKWKDVTKVRNELGDSVLVLSNLLQPV